MSCKSGHALGVKGEKSQVGGEDNNLPIITRQWAIYYQIEIAINYQKFKRIARNYQIMKDEVTRSQKT
jgi:hypothetical protein